MKTRKELATLVKPSGIVIELGVAAGKFAIQLMGANPAIEYLGIDRWSDHHDGEEYGHAKAVIELLGGKVMRSTFHDALPFIADESADLIYIDGYAHTGQDGGQTLDEWWPKLKRGGIFSGHDYHPEYMPTIQTVDAFVQKHGLILHIINENPYPSWWILKH